MRPVTVVAIGVLFAGSIVGNAQQPSQTTPTFRAGTTLVDFTVVAMDERGRPVTDLRREEIAVLEDDQIRDLKFFRFEGASGMATSPPAPLPLPPGTFTNRTEYAPGAPRHLVAIVLDFVNASLDEQFELRAQFLQYLKQIPADTQVGLYVMRNRTVAVHDFTQDAGSLRERIERGDLDAYERALASGADVQKLLAGARPEQRGALAALAESDAKAVQGFNVQIMRERRQKTLTALDSVGEHLAGVPGRKSLVWISRGFPLTSTLEASYVDEVRDTSRRLASQDVAVYPVDAAGLTATRGNPVEQGRLEGTSELVASVTGGRVTRNNNDLSLGLAAAAEDVRGTYSVAFYSPGDPDNRWHQLTVRALRPGVTLRHRQGYLATATPADQTQAWPQESWKEVAYRPLISTGLRIDARPVISGTTLTLALDVAADDLLFRPVEGGQAAELEMALVEMIANEPTNFRVNPMRVQFPRADAPNVIPLKLELRLNPRTESVRVIVRDKASGKLGSLDLPLGKVRKE